MNIASRKVFYLHCFDNAYDCGLLASKTVWLCYNWWSGLWQI